MCREGIGSLFIDIRKVFLTCSIPCVEGGPKDLAESFFPDEYDPKEPSTIWICKLSLTSPKWLGLLDETMMHELGHVLGLRHEFALEKGTATNFHKRTDAFATSESFNAYSYKKLMYCC